MGSFKGLSQNSSPYLLSKLSTHRESARSALGVRWVCTGSPHGVCWESAGSLLGVGSWLGICEMVSLDGLSKCALQIETFLEFAESFNRSPLESIGSLLEVCLKFEQSKNA